VKDRIHKKLAIENKSSIQYGVQLAIVMSIASLFFIFKSQLPSLGGIWVGISAVIVCETALGTSTVKWYFYFILFIYLFFILF